MHYADYKTILSPKNGFNLYRGCTHGCIYCDSRSACYQFTHDFEDIEVKRNAAAILEAQLKRKRKPCMLSSGAMCDPYLPLESELRLTRQCLDVIARHGFGVAVLTKSNLVLRDLDILARINAKAKAVVQMTLTTADEGLCQILEPNVCTTAERVKALEAFRDNGIPTAVWLCPILPWINDTAENIRGILDCCVRAKVKAIVHFGIGLTLRDGDREYYYSKLDGHFPGLKERYIKTFGNAYEIPSPNAAVLDGIIRETCVRHGIMLGSDNVFKWLAELPEHGDQLTFEDLWPKSRESN
ncbi:MAG: radical SAM protein [Oscillospiraceae bacterium]|jgi:DNA repair photolyase|nr:radical SAM protein [Oscillospiraceae bacterium]